MSESYRAARHSADILKEIILVDEDEDEDSDGDYILLPSTSLHADFVTLPISHYSLRNKVRDVGFPSDAARQFWWPILVLCANKESLDSIPDVTALARKKVVKFRDQLNERNSLMVPIDFSWDEDKCSNIAHNVVRLLVNDPDIEMEDPGLVHPFVKHISNIVTNTAICYSMCHDILMQPDWYLNSSIPNYRCKLLVFKQLIKRCMARTYAILESIGALEDFYLNKIFVDMFTSIFPPVYVNRVIEMYLLDGVKVLYRYGLALLKCHKKDLKNNTFSNGQAFWHHLSRYATGEAELDFEAVHNFAFDLYQPFYKTSIVPSRETLLAMENHIRANVSPVVLQLSLNLPYAISLPNSESIESLLHHKSKILDLFQARRLHAFLPESMRIEGFQLAFSTYKNGWNIHTLYDRVKGRSPCIILIKSVDAQAIIGVYLTCTLAPSASIRGDGDCFCFRLDGPDGACYRWAHGPNSTPLLEPEVYQNSLTYHQFALCNTDFMSFGGSSVHGSNAIRITSDLMTCHSGHSDTYNNPPLAPDEPSDPFQIADMEVFCGIARSY